MAFNFYVLHIINRLLRSWSTSFFFSELLKMPFLQLCFFFFLVTVSSSTGADPVLDEIEYLKDRISVLEVNH